MKIYAAWQKVKEMRKQSSSGAVFSAISDVFWKDGAYICGVILDYSSETPVAKHVITRDLDVIKKMRGSKYV